MLDANKTKYLLLQICSNLYMPLLSDCNNFS